MKKFVMLPLVALLGACGQEHAPNPTGEDVRRALSTMFFNNNVALLEAEPLNCIEATQDGASLLSCDVCITTASDQRTQLRDQPEIHRLGLSGTTITVSLSRAVSHDQPDLVPTDPREGVWVLRGSPNGRAALRYDDTRVFPGDDQPIMSGAGVPDDVAARVGYGPEAVTTPEAYRVFLYELMSEENRRFLLDTYGRCKANTRALP